jgi:thiol:disulfide interchange protein
MDANNFKNVFKNIFLNKKREKEEVDNANSIKNNQNEEENLTLNFQNHKKYVKYSDIIQQKIQENNKKEDILKKFDDLDNNEKYGKDVILKVAGMQKLKKQYEEDNKKSSINIKNKKGEKKSEGNIPDKAQKLNLELEEKSNEKNKETDKIENKNSNVDIYSSDSVHEENEN